MKTTTKRHYNIEAHFYEVDSQDGVRCYKVSGMLRLVLDGRPGPWVPREQLLAILPAFS